MVLTKNFKLDRGLHAECEKYHHGFRTSITGEYRQIMKLFLELQPGHLIGRYQLCFKIFEKVVLLCWEQKTCEFDPISRQDEEHERTENKKLVIEAAEPVRKRRVQVNRYNSPLTILWSYNKDN